MTMWREAFPPRDGQMKTNRVAIDTAPDTFKRALTEAWGSVEEVEVQEVVQPGIVGAWCYAMDDEGTMQIITMTGDDDEWTCDSIEPMTDEVQDATVKFERDRWWYAVEAIWVYVHPDGSTQGFKGDHDFAEHLRSLYTLNRGEDDEVIERYERDCRDGTHAHRVEMNL